MLKKIFAISGLLLCLAISPVTCFAAGSRGVTVDSSVVQADMDQLVQWKVNVVYYFLDPNATSIATDQATYLANLDTQLAIFDDRLAGYSARGIRVILNLYGAPGEFVDKRTPALHRVFAEEWAQTTLVEAWKVIATRYKDNTGIWGYNLLNEPAQASVAPGLKGWNDLSVQIVDAIRVIDSNVKLIIMATYGNPDRLKALNVIKDKGSISYAFNAYFPYNFTHQGLYGIKLGRKYPFKKTNKAYLAQGLSKGFKFAAKNKVELIVPEFTTVRWAPGSSTSKYVQDMIQLFETRKVVWTYHSYYGSKVETGPSCYPWSVAHTSNINSCSLSPNDTPQLKVLKKFFKRNS